LNETCGMIERSWEGGVDLSRRAWNTWPIGGTTAAMKSVFLFNTGFRIGNHLRPEHDWSQLSLPPGVSCAAPAAKLGCGHFIIVTPEERAGNTA